LSRLRRSLIRKARKAISKAHDGLAIPASITPEEGIVIEYDTGDRTKCNVCVFDPINDTSSDPDCQTCGGTGYLNNRGTIQIGAIMSKISPGASSEWGMSTAGRYDIGDVVLSCKLADVLVDSTNLQGDTFFDRAFKVTVQGEIYEVKYNPMKLGLAGDMYTCVVVLTKDSGAA